MFELQHKEYIIPSKIIEVNDYSDYMLISRKTALRKLWNITNQYMSSLSNDMLTALLQELTIKVSVESVMSFTIAQRMHIQTAVFTTPIKVVDKTKDNDFDYLESILNNFHYVIDQLAIGLVYEELNEILAGKRSPMPDLRYIDFAKYLVLNALTKEHNLNNVIFNEEKLLENFAKYIKKD